MFVDDGPTLAWTALLDGGKTRVAVRCRRFRHVEP
jgi:hypothetical protein